MKIPTKLTVDQKIEIDDMICTFLYELLSWSEQSVLVRIGESEPNEREVQCNLKQALAHAAEKVIEAFHNEG